MTKKAMFHRGDRRERGENLFTVLLIQLEAYRIRIFHMAFLHRAGLTACKGFGFD